MEPPLRGAWNGETWPSDLSRWSEADRSNGTISLYQTTPVKWSPFGSGADTAEFTIGRGECDPFDFCNSPLTERHAYALKVRAFTPTTYQDSNVVFFETRERLPVASVVLILSGIFLAGAVAVTISLIPSDYFYFPKLLPFVKQTPASSVLFASFRPSQFRKHASDLLRNEARLGNEFQLLGTMSFSLETPCLHGQRVDNRGKNRYGDILPFDVTRVELSTINGDPSTDYINASFIKGHTRKVEYIATQGPKRETCHDFYRMILEKNVGLIIMVTDLEENGIGQCYKYYPDVGSKLVFQDIEVRCSSEKDLKFCLSRQLTIKRMSKQVRLVQLHVEDWPEFGAPDDEDDLIKLCEHTRDIPHGGGLTLVHGTAGIGRSGTFIALDVLLNDIRAGDRISVFNTVLDLRRQRVNMVQTLAQYTLLYKCLLRVLSSDGRKSVANQV